MENTKIMIRKPIFLVVVVLAFGLAKCQCQKMVLDTNSILGCWEIFKILPGSVASLTIAEANDLFKDASLCFNEKDTKIFDEVCSDAFYSIKTENSFLYFRNNYRVEATNFGFDSPTV